MGKLTPHLTTKILLNYISRNVISLFYIKPVYAIILSELKIVERLLYMNKKLGIGLLLVGAYVVVLGGLFWNMTAPEGSYNVYDWFWGLSAGVVIAVGAALAMKKNLIFGLAGAGLALLGVVYSIVIVFVGQAKEGYFSIWILLGAILAAIGGALTIFFSIKDHNREKVYGKTLM